MQLQEYAKRFITYVRRISTVYVRRRQIILPRRTWRRQVTIPLMLGLLVLLCVAVFLYMQTPPAAFPLYERIEIPEGYTLSESATLLAERDVVRSALFLQISVLTRYPNDNVKAGIYYFETPLSVSAVAEAITHGTFGIPPTRVTIPEGLRIDQMADMVAAQSHITETDFVAAAEGYEGYLFPDTYHIPESFTADELVTLMYETFREKLKPYMRVIDASHYTLDDIITMASLIEREAGDLESKYIVSGILWRRITIDMPLQVDAAFEYALDKSAADLTRDDLAVDSPYNTYRYKGLPPSPIANPGLESVIAALDPVSTSYLFYLTAPDGTFHYSETYTEHEQNVNRYLR